MTPEEFEQLKPYALDREQIGLLKAYDAEMPRLGDAPYDDNLAWFFYVHAPDKAAYLAWLKATQDLEIAFWPVLEAEAQNALDPGEQFTPPEFSVEQFINYFTTHPLGKQIDYLARNTKTPAEFASMY